MYLVGDDGDEGGAVGRDAGSSRHVDLPDRGKQQQKQKSWIRQRRNPDATVDRHYLNLDRRIASHRLASSCVDESHLDPLEDDGRGEYGEARECAGISPESRSPERGAEFAVVAGARRRTREKPRVEEAAAIHRFVSVSSRYSSAGPWAGLVPET
uniref:Uncharacterized protein n=1 Tax=Oryza brachyantha TaxID=4533 RepID=J3LIL1_ORYBR